MPKISELNELTSLYGSDYIAVAHDTNGLPSTKKISVNNFANTISSNVISRIPTASNSVPGIFKVGSNFSVNSTGYLVSTTEGLPYGGSEGQILINDASGNPQWKFNPVIDATQVINSTNNYVASADDNYLFCDTNDVGTDITIILPSNVVQGKTYNIKQLTGAGIHKVIVTSDDPSHRLIENPITGELVNSFNIYHKGDLESWVHDGSVYRHTGTQTASPVFTVGANTYHQVVIQNSENGANSSGDLVLYSDTGNYETGEGPFVDLGIDSSNYNDPYYGNIWLPNDAYLYNAGGNLIIGPSDDNTIKFIAGGTNDENIKLAINSTAVFVNTDLIPVANVTYSLGNQNNQWKDLWVSNNTIYINNIPLTINETGTLLVNNNPVSGGGTTSAGNVEIIAKNNTWTFDGVLGNFQAPGNITVGRNNTGNESHFVIDATDYWTSIQWKNFDSPQDPGNTPFECQAQLLRVFASNNTITEYCNIDNPRIELVALTAIRPNGSNQNGMMISTSDGKIPDAPYNDGEGTRYNWIFGGDGQLFTPGLINFQENGYQIPSKTERTGEKLVLWDQYSTNNFSYSIGIEQDAMWFGVDTGLSSKGFKWYSGNTQVMDLTRAGKLTVNGDINVVGTILQNGGPITASTTDKVWTNPNNGQWVIREYNGGFSGAYNGTDPLVWFNSGDAPYPDGFSEGYQIRGGVVEYHAYDGQTTVIGSITFSSDGMNLPSPATHSEHSSGAQMGNKSFWNITANFPIQLAFEDPGNSRNIMVQWTSKIFYGNEYYC